MLLLGVDAGNSNIKIFGPYGERLLPSELGEYRERRLEQEFSDDDIIYEYKGKKGFAGTLAKYESQFTASRMGDSKAHEEMLIRVLLGLHRYSSNTSFSIVVGQPISMHTESEKLKMKKLLEGNHEITVNNEHRNIEIKRAEIAAEGGAAFWSFPTKGLVRVLDIGSGTVNGATILDGRYIDRDSFTILDGMETLVSNNLEQFTRKICLRALKLWDIDDTILICGGGSSKIERFMYEYFTNIFMIYPKVPSKTQDGGIGYTKLDPLYANAVGFYNIAKKVM